jgi:hypothetical protein
LGLPRVGLPVDAIKSKLFNQSRQRLVPFLGAGASQPSAIPSASLPPERQPSSELLTAIHSELALFDPAQQRFVEIALLLAQLVKTRIVPPPPSEETAPSSWELATQLAERVQVEPLRPTAERLQSLVRQTPPRTDYIEIVKDVAELLGLSRSVPELLTVASYFNKRDDRRILNHELLRRFGLVRTGTQVQDTIARCASEFVHFNNALTSRDPKRDYLIITTNYDSLVETKLALERVPTCVITVDKKSRVLTQFMPGAQEYLGLCDDDFRTLQRLYIDDDPLKPFKLAKMFKLENKQKSLAMVYKLHGCPVIDDKVKIDNIVISDQDYVSFIQLNGRSYDLIPAYVTTLLQESSFLFLGYSFGDWNVRSLYQYFVRNRPRASGADASRDEDDQVDEDRDYIVMRRYQDTDAYFFEQWDVSVLVTELDDFASQLSAAKH